MSKVLAGRRIIELGSMIAAPFATHILAQLGAEVIKIEPPTGDSTRKLVRGGPSGTFIAYNYGKKSLCVDLATPEGAMVFRQLALTADAVIHNLSPSAARKLGVTGAALQKLNPDLIVCHISGYADGPQADDLASNPVAEAATGAMYDHRVNGRPSRLGPSYHDQFAGCYAVIRVLSTWLQAEPSARDRDIRVGLYETGLHLAGRDLAGVQLKTQLLGRPETQGGGEFAMPGYGAYETRDERWVYLLNLTDAHWRRLATALDMPERNDENLATLRGRRKSREQVEAAVRKSVGALTFDEVSERLSGQGLGYTEVLPLHRVLDAAQANQPGKIRDVAWRGMHFEIPRFPGALDAPDNAMPPELGEDSADILDQLGIGPEAAQAAFQSGAVRPVDSDAFPYAPVSDRGSKKGPASASSTPSS
ncbi:CaiB/BaiF CoA transferase family protein [Actinophytocola sp.]|uniref:CaiB/BaiF CoA transferase family protein n=1 Tax=Actinophytocola sp. TaxID=1872138 RepID=UPI003D6B31FC